MTKEFLEQIVSLGIVGYPLSKILNIIPDDIDKDDFILEFNNPESPVAKAYQKGIDKRDYDIDIRLFELAKSGDLKALGKYEERLWERQQKK